jgi:hypothetical protein
MIRKKRGPSRYIRASSDGLVKVFVKLIPLLYAIVTFILKRKS